MAQTEAMTEIKQQALVDINEAKMKRITRCKSEIFG